MKFGLTFLPALAVLGGSVILAGCATGPATADGAAIEATGACTSLPAGVECACVVTTAQAAIPTTRVPRAKNESGSRLGRGKVTGGADPRIAIAVANARQSCAAGKAGG